MLQARAKAKAHQQSSQDIPIPTVILTGSYNRDYLPNFQHPTTYVRGRGIASKGPCSNLPHASPVCLLWAVVQARLALLSAARHVISVCHVIQCGPAK